MRLFDAFHENESVGNSGIRRNILFFFHFFVAGGFFAQKRQNVLLEPEQFVTTMQVIQENAILAAQRLKRGRKRFESRWIKFCSEQVIWKRSINVIVKLSTRDVNL